MNFIEAMEKRHSVRNYNDKKIEENIKLELENFIKQINKESVLNIQLICDEEKAFGGFMAKYGNFIGVKNYIALVGKKNKELDEKCGYYGEKIVLKAQTMGLNTCWVGMTYNKNKESYQINKNEKLCMVIAIGYGNTQGVSHKVKNIEEVTDIKERPIWFENGIKYSLLAPTAMNQQKFKILLDGNKVSIKAGMGFYTKVDLGIVKYHFELGAGKENFDWE